MKAKSVTAKPYIIPSANGNKTLLAPAAAFVELEEGYDQKYVQKLEEIGCIKTMKESTAKTTVKK